MAPVETVHAPPGPHQCLLDEILRIRRTGQRPRYPQQHFDLGFDMLPKAAGALVVVVWLGWMHTGETPRLPRRVPSSRKEMLRNTDERIALETNGPLPLLGPLL